MYRWRARRIEAAARASFHEQLVERARAASEVHDTLLQTIEASKMIVDDALDSPQDLPHMRQTMDRLSAWLGQATQEGQKALQVLRSSMYDDDDLVTCLRRILQEFVAHGNIDFDLLVRGETLDMHPEVRNEICRIGHAAISSACRSSHASRVDVIVTYLPDFCLQVLDNGTSGDPCLAEGSSLEAMRRRAEHIGAALAIAPSSLFGTEFKLTIPGAIDLRRAPAGAAFTLTDLWNRLWPRRERSWFR
jgi:signal transduction histidine kinase